MMNRQLLLLLVVIATIVCCNAKKATVVVDGTVHQVHTDNRPKRATNVERPVHVVETSHASSGSAESDAHMHGYRKVPKLVKMTTKLELCKQECKRQQDEEDAQQYVERLRFELSAAELALQQHVDAMRQQLHQYESQQHHSAAADHHSTADEHRHQEKHA